MGNPHCWSSKTSQQMVLYFLTLTLMLVLARSAEDENNWNKDKHQIFNFTNSGYQWLKYSLQNSSTCHSDICKEEAMDIMYSIDPGQDPCEDFYQFSCGGWERHHTKFPKDKDEMSILSELQKNITRDLRRLMRTKLVLPVADHVMKIRNIYESCMNVGHIKYLGLQPLTDIRLSLDSEMIVENGTLQVNDSEWINTVGVLRKLGYNYNFPLSISEFWDHILIGGRVILFKELLGGRYLEDSFDILKSSRANLNKRNLQMVSLWLGFHPMIVRDDLNDVILIDAIVSIFTWISLLPHIVQLKVRPCIFESLSPPNEAEKLKPKEIEEKIRACLHSAMSGMKVNKDVRNRRAQLHYTYLYTIKELQGIAPEIDWLRYLNVLLDDPLKENETIIIPEITPLRYVAKFMKGINKTVMATYFFWQAVQQFQDTLVELTPEGDSWKRCLGYISKYLDVGLGSFYIKKYFSGKNKQKATELSNYIQEEFVNILDGQDWMDSNTKQNVKREALAIKTQMGYPDELLNDKVISSLYKSLNTSDYYINTHMRIKKLEIDKMFSKIHNRNDGWKEFARAMDVEILYDPSTKKIHFPAGRLQKPYFHKDRPQYMNFGSLGNMIAREVTYRFNQNGKRKDKNLKPIWGTWMDEKYNQKGKCIVDQYRNYRKENELEPSDDATKDLDVADNEGLKIAYKAYSSWVKDHDIEPLLPGLEKFTQKQLFWISSARVMCGKHKQNRQRKSKGDANIWKLRVLGAISNQPEFSQDFKCKVGSKMNPETKCQGVW